MLAADDEDRVQGLATARILDSGAACERERLGKWWQGFALQGLRRGVPLEPEDVGEDVAIVLPADADDAVGSGDRDAVRDSPG